MLIPDVLVSVALPDGSHGRIRKRWRWACQNPGCLSQRSSRRLAWPLHRNDTLFRGRPTNLKFCFVFRLFSHFVLFRPSYTNSMSKYSIRCKLMHQASTKMAVRPTIDSSPSRIPAICGFPVYLSYRRPWTPNTCVLTMR